jgi:hypothetical protein
MAMLGRAFMHMGVSLCKRRMPSMGPVQGVDSALLKGGRNGRPKAPVPGRILKREDVLC